MDEAGIAHGNDWAKGFLRGMRVRPHSWQELLDDEERGGGLVLILMLAHEDDPATRTRPAPIKPERRQEALAHLAAEVMLIYRYFAPARRAYAKALHEPHTQRRDPAKIGRNEPCPCGSGKKYKACCGRSHVLH